ncbi:hypothetical protein GR925_16030 [Streptomyces sp. HUCO-GS316]|nr:hypothetical protein [Streptomyces sp. HUCO-GS316]
MKVGWFTSELDPHKILLLSGTSGRWNLLVVPPQTDDPAAAGLMAAASAGTGPRWTASALMAAEQPDGTASSSVSGAGRRTGRRRACDGRLTTPAFSDPVTW